ncbi:uroporphyrinogen-III C-methyltransferase [Myxacorys almedinensis]|uniref:uroporphyrinogen-III C-methyltransferase n=1 Tax=Myxacorys almedinensis A TaxID=2690445 RepID=A0A8J7Z1Z8_9CYAN|nr:uroporphyrinogen-III C-methyltransferase [Myxacorys almedinensis]NDJ16331.1 uroporphyrinogen-III C-methyltransferase [Myxacorys almedinensis A]
MTSTGKVYLVGSGPGDVGNLTVRAYRLLQQAEVLVYDALVDAEFLDLVPEYCLKLDVGKRGGQPSMKQAEIDRLLVKHCQQHQQVVRLKSGDPFIFGRTTSEIEALKAAACEYEVIPGLSSALAAPLLAGIPLTDPVLSRGFAVITAHEPERLNWQALAQLDTLVVLMGGKHLPLIVEQLQRQGKSPDTAIAIIRWAAHPNQEIWISNLTEILSHVTPQRLSPCVIVIGEVVGLRPFLTPNHKIENSDPKQDVSVASEPAFVIPPQPQTNPELSVSTPFSGKTILVTRAAGQSGHFSRLLEQQGATVIEMPTLEIVPPSSWEELDDAISQLSEFDWLILTSTNAVEYFFDRLGSQLQDVAALTNIKIAVVGEKTALKLKQRGMQPDFVPPDFVAEAMIVNFPESVEGKKLLFPRVETGGRETLVNEFKAQGANITEVAAYQSACPQEAAPHAIAALKNRTVDVITFASSKTVKHFCELLDQAMGEGWRDYLETPGIASIGPQTSKTSKALLGRIDIEAEEYTLEGLISAIALWIDRNPKI